MEDLFISKLDNLQNKDDWENHQRYINFRWGQIQNDTEQFICQTVNTARWELLRRCIVEIMFHLELPFDFVYNMLSAVMPKENKKMLKSEVYSWMIGMKTGAFEETVTAVKNVAESMGETIEKVIELLLIPQLDIPYILHGLTLESENELREYAYKFGRERLEYIEKKMELDVIPIRQKGLRNYNIVTLNAVSVEEADCKAE